MLSKGDTLYCNLFDLLFENSLGTDTWSAPSLLLSGSFHVSPALKISCNLTFLVLEVKLSTATSFGSEQLANFSQSLTFRIKLMVVEFASVGKTFRLNCLFPLESVVSSTLYKKKKM